MLKLEVDVLMFIINTFTVLSQVHDKIVKKKGHLRCSVMLKILTKKQRRSSCRTLLIKEVSLQRTTQ